MAYFVTEENVRIIMGCDDPEKIALSIGTSLAWLTNAEAARLRDMLGEALGEGAERG